MTTEKQAPLDRSVPDNERPRDLHVIINPVSGNGWAGSYWPSLKQRLENLGFTLYDRLTTGPGDATDLARSMVKDGAREIVVVGGDGAMNEVVNGILSAPEDAARDVILSVLPCGTGRDFSRSLGITSFDHALHTLVHGQATSIDAGAIRYVDKEQIHTRYFVNAADAGLGAEAAAWINGSSKRLGGFLTYFLGAARTIVVFQGKQACITIDDACIYDGMLSMVCLANGRYHAGGMLMAPDASMRDGLLDVLVLKSVSKWQLLTSVLPRVYFGKHIGHPAVVHYRGRHVQIKADQPLRFEVDGEQPGTTDLEAEVLPAALRVRVPGAQTPDGENDAER